MNIIDLTEEQIELLEDKLNQFDETYMTYKMDGSIQIGIEENELAGKRILRSIRI